MERGTNIRIALAGGDARWSSLGCPGAEISHFESSRHDGGHAVARLVAQVHHGAFAAVIVMARWFGHDKWAKLRAACDGSAVPLLVCTGGRTAAMRAIEEWLRRPGSGSSEAA